MKTIEFLASRSAINKILRRIKRITIKDHEQIVLYLSLYKINPDKKDIKLKQLIKNCRKNDQKSIKDFKETQYFKNAQDFWTEKRIEYFKKQFRNEFFDELFKINSSRAYRRGDDEPVNVIKPQSQETEEIMKWFTPMLFHFQNS